MFEVYNVKFAFKEDLEFTLEAHESFAEATELIGKTRAISIWEFAPDLDDLAKTVQFEEKLLMTGATVGEIIFETQITGFFEPKTVTGTVKSDK